jgi:hypothetical protein
MIIVGDLANYLRMSYISYWLENVLRENQNTTLFYSPTQMLSMWLRMVDETAPTKTAATNIPIDETEYDHSIDNPMLKAAFEELRVFLQYAPALMAPDLNRALDMTQHSIIHPKATIEVQGEPDTRIKKGLMSGWRWTAFLNTLLNAGKVNAYRERIMQRLGLPSTLSDPVTSTIHQGDDLRARAKSPPHAQMLYNMYAETGFKVNLSKVFLQPNTDEYLRQLAENGQTIGGYPARGVASLLYRNPTSREFDVGEDRIFELASNWLVVGRRCSTNWNLLESFMVRDLSRANAVAKSDIEKLIHASATNGGLGLLPLNNYQVKLIKSRRTVGATLPPVPLAGGFKYSEIVSKLWSKGIEYGPKVEVKYTKFSLETQLAEPHLGMSIPVILDFTLAPMAPSTRRDVSPSTIAMYQEKVKGDTMATIKEEASEWLDLSGISKLYKLSNKTSLAVVKAWLTDDLPFRTPSSALQAPSLVAPLYKSVSSQMWAKIAVANKFTMGTIRRVAMEAERVTIVTANRFPIRMYG